MPLKEEHVGRRRFGRWGPRFPMAEVTTSAYFPGIGKQWCDTGCAVSLLSSPGMATPITHTWSSTFRILYSVSLLGEIKVLR